MNSSNEEQLGHSKYRKCICQAYCGEEGKFISIRRYNSHARKRKRDELMLCKEDGQSIQNHRGEESIDNNTSAELPQIDPTEEDDFFHDSGQETETSEVLSDYEFQVLDMDEEQTIDAMEIVTEDSGGKSWF